MGPKDSTPIQFDLLEARTLLSAGALFPQLPAQAHTAPAEIAGKSGISVDDYGSTIEQAATVQLNQSGRGLAHGRIDFAGDDDMLSVVSAMTGQMQVEVAYRGKSPHGDPELYIYDAAGELLAHDDGGASGNSGASFDVIEGQTYYLKVAGHPPSRGAGRYLVKIATEESTDPDPQPHPTVAATVVGRYVFYNDSIYDGNDPAANSTDDTAVDTSKSALLPGETASFDNYITYVSGINGIMIDIAGSGASVTADDFEVRLSGVNGGDSVDDYLAGPTPISVTVREGAGVDGSDRITLIFADTDAYNSQWMQITVKANANTGLGSDDVFYYGLAIGDTGDSTTEALVNDADREGARANPHTGFDPANATDAYDFNRDSNVNATDRLIIRSHETTLVDALKMITAP